jgi:hypothetical protein
VGVGIDEAGHDPLPAGVDDFDVVSVFQLYVGGQPPRALDAITLDDNGLVPRRRIFHAVYQGPVGDHDSFFTVAAHLTPPMRGHCALAIRDGSFCSHATIDVWPLVRAELPAKADWRTQAVEKNSNETFAAGAANPP